MNAVIYVRVSTDDQVQNYSLTTQQQACEGYCRAHSIEAIRVFREEGESAKTANRPELRALIDYCSRNRREIDLLVIHRTDRLARNVEDHSWIKASLLKFGVRVVSVQEGYDDSPMGRFVENLMASVAQLDNDQRSVRTGEGMRAAASAGRWIWTAPIGYIRPVSGGSSASLIPDTETASLVRLAFEIYSEGRKTIREVWEHVTALGLRRSNGKSISLQSFGAMLKNPIYRGRVVSPSFGIDVPGDFEPIVSEELFERVQAVNADRSNRQPKRRRDHPDFPLRRVIRCGACDAPLTGSWSTGRSKQYA